MSALDRVIEVVAPRAALKRAQARMALSHVRAYEAAMKGRRTDGWKTAGTSANTETRSGLIISRNRARDLVRNNPYAARAVSVIAANMVGYGIKTTPQTANKKASKPLLKAWLAWAESTECDADGMHNMYGLQELAARCIVESGEVLIRRVWSKDAGLTVPMKIQVLEPDYIDTSREGVNADNKNTIIQGVEFDSRGRRVAYWMHETHPGEVLFISTSRNLYASKRVSAEDILHVHRADRAGQVRGVTWFAPVVIRLRDFDEYEDARLMREKIAACFTAFVSDSDTPEATGSAKAAELTERLEPAAIEFLPPGKTVTFANPPNVQGYNEYASVVLHAIAVGLGIPYESLTGDFAQVNFTSGKMARSEFYALLDVWQWNMFIPKFCGGVFGWFTQAAVLAGLPAQGATAKFTPPRRTLVDPTRELPALIKAVRGGLENMPNAINAMGYEPEEFVQAIADFNALLDKHGVVLDSDPRKITNGGQAQVEPGNDNSASNANDDEAGGKDTQSKDAA